MFKTFVIFVGLFIAVTSAGFIQTHHVVEPVVAKVGTVVHSAPSAVSHQSFTRVYNKAVVQDVVAPVVKTVVTPVVHAAPVAHLVKTVATPVVHTYAAPNVVKTVHSAPVVHHSYVAAPAVVKTVHHAVPVVQKTYVATPAFVKTVATPVFNVATSHQSHTQIHHQKAVITPVVKSYIAASVVPVVHTHAHIAKTYLH